VKGGRLMRFGMLKVLKVRNATRLRLTNLAGKTSSI